jgi:uncharacterized RDD family membrane protein YckC
VATQLADCTDLGRPALCICLSPPHDGEALSPFAVTTDSQRMRNLISRYCARLAGDSPVIARRAVACINDTLLLVLIWVVVGYVLLPLLTADPGVRKDAGIAITLLWIFPFIALYYTLFEASVGATPGKMLMGLKVLKVDGRSCTLVAALIRNLLRYVDAMPFGWYLVGTALFLATPRRQRLGDLVAGTVVRRNDTLVA